MFHILILEDTKYVADEYVVSCSAETGDPRYDNTYNVVRGALGVD